MWQQPGVSRVIPVTTTICEVRISQMPHTQSKYMRHLRWLMGRAACAPWASLLINWSILSAVDKIYLTLLWLARVRYAGGGWPQAGPCGRSPRASSRVSLSRTSHEVARLLEVASLCPGNSHETDYLVRRVYKSNDLRDLGVDLIRGERVCTGEERILNWKLTLPQEISWIWPLSLAPHFGAAKVAKTFGRRSPRLTKIRSEGPLSRLLARNWIYKQRRFMGETNCSIRAFTVAAWEKGERGKVWNCTFFKCLLLCQKQKFTFLHLDENTRIK